MEICTPPDGFNTKEDICKAPVTVSLLFFFFACFYGIFTLSPAVVLIYFNNNEPNT
jgi:hypothetical protein